jgi:hypothetical protein
MRKLLVVGVIILFLGLACAPSINANISKESELVEITTEICGLNGGKHTVQLTKEEAEEVDRLFDSIRERLNATESREEAVEVFNEVVMELDKYGLIGGLSVNQAQKLLTGGEVYTTIFSILEKYYPKNNILSDKYLINIFCFIDVSSEVPLLKINIPIFYIPLYISYILSLFDYGLLYETLLFLLKSKPIAILNHVFGNGDDFCQTHYGLRYAFNSGFIGNVYGFTGIKFKLPWDYIYMGRAMLVTGRNQGPSNW